MTYTLLGIGIFGFLGLSVLCPLLAVAGHFFRVKRTKASFPLSENGVQPILSVDIIVPAYNEAELIGTTLDTIDRSVQYLLASPIDFRSGRPHIKVGANGCTDSTTQIAQTYPMVSVKELKEKSSKWVTIKSLVENSTADWVILMDAGTVWPENLLSEFIQRIQKDPSAIAVAPSYTPQRSGWLHRILWRLEMSLKKIEASCGGPVSLHGATVAYQTAALKKALAYLGDTLWLNDDVVIPLILRSLNPEGVILYPVGQVQDLGTQNDQLDLGRRKRMLRGNLQWASTLLPDCFRLNPIVGILAGRRLFRIFWAYWFSFILLAIALQFHIVLPALAAFIILAVLFGSFRQLAGAAMVSLMAPLQWGRTESLGSSWK